MAIQPPGTTPLTVPPELGNPTELGHDWIQENPAVGPGVHCESKGDPHRAFIKLLTFRGSPGDPLFANLWIFSNWTSWSFSDRPPVGPPPAEAIGLVGFNGGPLLSGLTDWISLGSRTNFEVFCIQAYFFDSTGARAVQTVLHKTQQYTNGYLSSIAFGTPADSRAQFVVGLAVANLVVRSPFMPPTNVPILS